MSGKPKALNSNAVFQATEANPVSSTQRVSGEQIISLSIVACHIPDLFKNIRSRHIMSYVIKISQTNFLLTQFTHTHTHTHTHACI